METYIAVVLEMTALVLIGLIGLSYRSLVKRIDGLDNRLNEHNTKVSETTREIYSEIRDFRKENGQEHSAALQRVARLEALIERGDGDHK